ncbi:MAG: lysine exporter LysO family protein [Alysiella sp.]|uniref:lysine exporter LysO family protein n=1 Tax=Alysiella sp. TaxID=1872483 RepID=UPI0026DD1AA9|nr:lysine exporter LysO family protein [Alysiella sp.]MDO4433461.1 lysine exporter LysO family protein [Alysiella sp.]
MENISTLIMVLTPMFIGFAIHLPKTFLPILDKLLNILVYIILAFIGMGLAKVDNLLSQINDIALYVAILFGLLILCNLVALQLFDRFFPATFNIKTNKNSKKISISGSLKQLSMVALGLIFGLMLPENALPPEKTGTYALMLLIGIVGIQLRSNGIPLRQVLLNKRGLQVSIIFMLSCAAAGLLFALCFEPISWHQGLALASGYGWYSLSGIVMTQAYGATWGSVALLNDLLREFFALAFIPALMRHSPASAVGIGGATSLDFTLPIIQSSGGLAVVPLAISFGFVVNLLSPILMVMFSSLS